MALVINTNIASMQAQKNLSNTQQQQSVTFQRLSTGLRINSAKDDAGGLYLAEAQTKDIRGLNMATRNAGDGISMAQTAEGALDQIGKNLQRVNELAIQSANGSYNDAARGGLQKEVDELTQEINRIVETTEFNGHKLLSKDATQTDLQIGFKNDAGSVISTGLEGGLAVQGDTRKFGVQGLDGISFHTKDQAAGVAKDFMAKQLLNSDTDPADIYGAQVYAANTDLSALGATGGSATDTSKAIDEGLRQLGNGESFTVDGMTFSRQEQEHGDKLGQQLKIEFNGKETTIDDAWNATTGAYTDTAKITATNSEDLFGAPTTSNLAPLADQYFGSTALTEIVTGDVKVAGLQVFTDQSLNKLKGGESLEIDGITYTRSGSSTGTSGAADLKISSAYGETTVSGAFAASNGTEVANLNGGATVTGTNLTDVFKNAGQAVQERGVMGDLLNGDLSGTKVIDISSQASARAAIDFTRDSIDLVSELRATFGAVQNRFEAVIAGNDTYTENLSAARSRVQDADFAQETAALAKQQVLQQAGVSVLGQANATTQSVLGLL